MANQHTACLFDQWVSMSAPLFHTSTFWPVFPESEVKKFIMGTDGQPVFSKDTDMKAILETKSKILKFIEVVKAYPNDQYACKNTYLEFEYERLDVLDLILHAGDNVFSKKYNDKLFGTLPELHYSQALQYLKYQISAVDPHSAEVKAAKEYLISRWTDIEASDALKSKISTIETYRKSLIPYCETKYSQVDEMLEGIDKILTSEQTKELLDAGIKFIIGNSTQWRAIIKTGAPNIFIDYDQKAIVVPADRQYAKQHIKGLIIHEVGVHVKRSVNGLSSAERLSGYGLAGYGPAEEALGVLLETASKKTSNYDYSFISLALIENSERIKNPTFRDAFTMANSLILCLENPHEALLVAKNYAYKRQAFSRAIRIMRLGTGEVAERSTTKYWRGLLQITEYFDQIELDTSSIDIIMLGKYDINNLEQLKLLKDHKL